MRQKRTEAVGLYDEAIRLMADGKRAKAEKILERIITEFPDVIEVAAKARALLHPRREERPAPEPERRERVEKAACPACGGEIPLVRGALTVWCDSCEHYVRLERGGR